MIEISASILEVIGKENATSIFYNLETAKIDYFHIDVMDGKFVKRNTSEIMREFALTISHISNIGLDVHLMVENVEEFVYDYEILEPKIITFHIEAIKNKDKIKRIINYLKENNIKVGIALSPDTKIDEIKEYLPYIHMVLIMTVVPGEGGQQLILSTLEKVKELKKYIEQNNIDIDIQVDGGINNNTFKDAINSGANILVPGSYLISSENYTETIKLLKN